jgi:hypothetical protein
VANNPCTICPDGATVGEEIVPYSNNNMTCKDLINAALTFDAESEMCFVYAKEDEFECCPGSTTAFDDYCNICPDGITASNDFVPWSAYETCKDLVEEAKLYDNGSVGCNYYKGYEMSCCPRAGTDSENTTPSFTSIPTISPTIGKPETRAWTIVDKIASVVGVASALVAAAFAFAKWKRKMKSSSTPAIPTPVAPSPNMTSSIISTLTPQSAVPQTIVCNTPIPSQQNPTQGPRRSSLGFSRSFSSRI